MGSRNPEIAGRPHWIRRRHSPAFPSLIYRIMAWIFSLVKKIPSLLLSWWKLFLSHLSQSWAFGGYCFCGSLKRDSSQKKLRGDFKIALFRSLLLECSFLTTLKKEGKEKLFDQAQGKIHSAEKKYIIERSLGKFLVLPNRWIIGYTALG